MLRMVSEVEPYLRIEALRHIIPVLRQLYIANYISAHQNSRGLIPARPPVGCQPAAEPVHLLATGRNATRVLYQGGVYPVGISNGVNL